MKISNNFKLLLSFLKKKEEERKSFHLDELLTEVGWAKSTFRTYWSKGLLSNFISAVGKDIYEASNCQKISDVQFSKLLSQSKHRRDLGHNCQHKLTKALLAKSRDNMLLALELYNRPSIENRMDAFVMCFCASWEQLLKAVLIEERGENSIFIEKNNEKRPKKTLSLRECLAKTFPEESMIRKNIEQIITFRNQAVHLLMPEIQGITSRIFQSGVINFKSYFEEFTEMPFLNNSCAGMFFLVSEFKVPHISVLKSLYGNIANDILELATTLEKDINSNNNTEYAIPLYVNLVLAKNSNDENQITLSSAVNSSEDLKKAIIIEKPVDRAKTHPYLRRDAILEINQKLDTSYSDEELKKYLTDIDKETGKSIINTNTFEAVMSKNNWKSANNEYHHKNSNPEYHYYSPALVDEFIKKIMSSENYIASAKESYNRSKSLSQKSKG